MLVITVSSVAIGDETVSASAPFAFLASAPAVDVTVEAGEASFTSILLGFGDEREPNLEPTTAAAAATTLEKSDGFTASPLAWAWLGECTAARCVCSTGDTFKWSTGLLAIGLASCDCDV